MTLVLRSRSEINIDPRHFLMPHLPVRAHMAVFPNASITFGFTALISASSSLTPSQISGVTHLSRSRTWREVFWALDLAMKWLMSLEGGRILLTLVRKHS